MAGMSLLWVEKILSAALKLSASAEKKTKET